MNDGPRPQELSAGTRELLETSLAKTLPDAKAATRERLLATARVRIVVPREHIYRQGEPVPITLILRGFGAARRTTSGGKELVSGVATAGILFGWSGLASVPSSIELVAITDCEVAQWPGADMRTMVAADPGLALTAIDSMAWSLHPAVERIEGFLHQDARLRVLKILAQHRDLFFGEPPILTRAPPARSGRHDAGDDGPRAPSARARGNRRARRSRRAASPPTGRAGAQRGLRGAADAR